MSSRTRQLRRPPALLVSVLVVSVLLAFTAACGSTAADPSAGPSDPDPAVSVDLEPTADGTDDVGTEQAVEATDTATGVSGEFATIDGSSIDLGPLAGQDVVLWFWAPW